MAQGGCFATLVASLEVLPQPLQGCPKSSFLVTQRSRSGNVGLEDPTASRLIHDSIPTVPT
jgi:hypothetical protein